jgi:transposase
MSTAAPLPEPLAPGQVPLPTPEQLPDDPETLKQMIMELVTTLRQRDHDLEAARQRLHLLLQRLYGRRSERFDPAQPLLFTDASDSPNDASETTAPDAPADQAAGAAPPGKRRCRPHGRRRLPENLPRRPVDHVLSEAERICVCGQRRVDIGTESGGEQLDWQPASYFVWQHRIHKYLCPHCAGPGLARLATTAAAALPATQAAAAVPPAVAPAEPVTPATDFVAATAEPVAPAAEPPAATPPVSSACGPAIITAPKPAMPIDKGLPGAGLLAHFIVSKYFDHLPLYRQENISERQGVKIPRSTSCDWMADCADRLRPLYDLMVTSILQSVWLHTDDTPVKNLDHEPGTTDKARFWIYYGDRAHPYNVFDFTVNRQRDGPQTFLADFHGHLHADAFSGYDALYLPSPRAGTEPIKEVACNAHARRKFNDAKLSDELHAHQALAYYGQLYELERAARDGNFDDEQRLRMRQELALPILDKFKAWLDEQRGQVLPKSPMAEAIGYALNNWTALIRYTEAGFLSIDNNVAEREMKRIAIGRKNWLFVGSANGGRTAAVLFSFTSTCHRLKIEPWAYLQDVLTRLPRTSAANLAELLPDRWQAARQQAATARTEAAAASPPPP